MPDIHWHVGEDQDQETVAHTSTPRRSRRSWIAIAIVVILGVGLGVVYRSLPESQPQPIPTPSPIPEAVPTRPAIPTALFQTIDREAQALADGDFAAYRDLHVPYGFDEQQSTFAAWGRPANNAPPYEIVDFNLLPNASAWADIRQWRNGRYFRETRFYYRRAIRWLRGQPTSFLWNGTQESLHTPHFDVTYAVEDRAVLTPTLNQLEEDYQSLCADLNCALLGHELTFTLKLDGTEQPSIMPGKGEILLPSPRVTGFFEGGRAYSWKTSYAHSLLVQAIGERVYGAAFDRPGRIILWVGLVWALNRVEPLPAEIRDQLGHLNQAALVPLAELWAVPTGQETTQVMVQAFYLLSFVEQRYGAEAVTHLLGTIATTTSLSDAFENGLSVPFTEFDQQWQAWAKQNIAN